MTRRVNEGVEQVSANELFRVSINSACAGSFSVEKDLVNSLSAGANPHLPPAKGENFAIVRLINSGNSYKNAYISAIISHEKYWNPSPLELYQIILADIRQGSLTWARWAATHINFDPSNSELNEILSETMYKFALVPDKIKDAIVFMKSLMTRKGYKADSRLNLVILYAAFVAKYEFLEFCLEQFKPAEIKGLLNLNHHYINTGTSHGYTLHFAVRDGRADIVSLLMDLGASANERPKAEEPTLRSTPPIAYAFQLNKEEIILNMLRHPGYSPKTEDFQAYARNYLLVANKSSPVFEEIFIRLMLLQSGDYTIGRDLMAHVCDTPSFKLNTPELFKFGNAYLKIFGRSAKRENVDIQAGLKELETCDFGPAKILLELRCEFSIGIPENLTQLIIALRETPFEHHQALARANVQSALIVADALRTGKFKGRVNLAEASHYYQLAAEADPKKISAYCDFVKSEQVHLGVVELFIEFTGKQKDTRRDDCEAFLLDLDLNEEQQAKIASQNLPISDLIVAKNPRLSVSERFEALKRFLTTEHSRQLKLKAYSLCKALLGEARNSKLRESINEFFSVEFKSQKGIGDLYGGLAHERMRAETLTILLEIDQPLSRSLLIHYFTASFAKETQDSLEAKLKREAASLNVCERAAVHSCLALRTYEHIRSRTITTTTRDAVRKECEAGIEAPTTKEFLATLFRDSYFWRQSSEETAQAPKLFYDAACQFFDIYRFAMRDEAALLERAMENLCEATKLTHDPAVSLFKRLLEDSELNDFEKGIVDQFYQKYRNQLPVYSAEDDLKVEDFNTLDESSIDGFIMQALLEKQMKKSRDYLETAAAINPIIYTKRVLNLLTGDWVNAEFKMMLLECAQSVLNKHSPKAQGPHNYSESPQMYLHTVNLLLQQQVQVPGARMYPNPQALFATQSTSVNGAGQLAFPYEKKEGPGLI